MPGSKKDILAVTALSSYLYCARKLYLEKVMKIREPPKEVMVKGTIRHKFYEDINNADQDIVTAITEHVSLDDLKKVYENKFTAILQQVIRNNIRNIDRFGIRPEQMFSEIKPYLKLESSLRADKIFSFMDRTKLLGAELWNSITPKIRSEYRIESESLMLRGIIDQLEVHGDLLIPVELKTGSIPDEGVWDSHKIQLAAYLVLLEDMFKKEFNKGVVRYLDHDEDREVVMNPFLKDEVLKTRKDVSELLKKDTPPGFPDNKNKCKSCGLKERCYGLE